MSKEIVTRFILMCGALITVMSGFGAGMAISVGDGFAASAFGVGIFCGFVFCLSALLVDAGQ